MPGVADDRDQLATLAPPAPAPRPRRAAPARARGRRTRDSCRRSGAARAPSEPERRHRLALALQRQRLDRLRRRPRRATSASVASPISTSPGCAACCSRAATFTASPVASRSSVPVTTSPVLTPIRPSIPSSGERLPHLHRRPAGPQRVVLVHHRHPEHRHHRVADELLHRAAVRLDDPLHPLEIPRQQRPQRLRIRRLPERRRPDHVAEQHRHDLPALTRPAAQRSTARLAEPAPSLFSCPQRAQTITARA